MNNVIFLQIEIIVFLLSWVSIIYFIFDKIWRIYFKIKKIVISEDISKQKSAINKINLESEDNIIKKEDYKNKKLTESDKVALVEILKKIKVNSFKWSYGDIKYLIIEWLTIDKYNKELNLELASVYESENNYKHAEFIYSDLVQIYPWDIEILKKYAFVCAVENKMENAFKIYEKVYEKQKTDNEILIMLSEIAYKIKKYQKCLKYINFYLVDYPRDLDKLIMKWKCLEETWKKEEALIFYKKVANLYPYNALLKNRIIELSK